MCWEWDDSGELGAGGECVLCFIFFKANALSLWPHDISCAAVLFEVCWGKSVFVSLDFICPAEFLRAVCRHSQKLDITNYQCTKWFNSEPLKPIQKYFITDWISSSLSPFSVLSFCLFLVNEWLHNIFTERYYEKLLKNSMKCSVKVIIPLKHVCT